MAKKIISLFYCILLITICVNAQSIKGQLQQKQQQQQYENEQRENELKEQIRIKKAQLNLNDLLQLLQSKDLDYVDRFLTGKGWKLHATNVSGTDEYEDETTTDYKTVTWSFDKNSYNDLAKGWFYFYLYPTYDNAIAYTIADETQLDKLKSELTSSGYKRIYPTDVIERGLESVYRNSLYEVNFKKQLKKKHEDGADIHYNFFIYNYKQVEERREEAERIMREAAEKEEQYQNAVQRAESAYYQKQYATAKQAYNEALLLKPTNREMLSDIIADIDINILCKDADRFFKDSQYDKAKAKYADALMVKPNKKTDYINGKIREITDFQQFLKERTYKQYDYKTLETADYKAKDDYIESEIKKNLLANAENLPRTMVNIVCEIDTLGNVVSNYTVSIQNKNLNVLLEELTKNIKLKRCFINGYSALAKAEFIYMLEYNHSVISVKNTPDGTSSNHKDFGIYRSTVSSELGYNAPYGKYTFDMNKITINGQVFDNNKLVKMSGSGGASNAWLSLLVPGLGDHRVTYGKRKGIGIAVTTYGLIGAGVGLKLYSNSEYRKYHAATEQSAMDKHYQAANFSNQAFYACVGTAAVIWIYDIIWVAAKGTKNAKTTKQYKKAHLGAYSDPNFNTTGLSYTINF